MGPTVKVIGLSMRCLEKQARAELGQVQIELELGLNLISEGATKKRENSRKIVALRWFKIVV